MKYRITATVLALLMLASTMTACGEKNDHRDHRHH